MKRGFPHYWNASSNTCVLMWPDLMHAEEKTFNSVSSETIMLKFVCFGICLCLDASVDLLHKLQIWVFTPVQHSKILPKWSIDPRSEPNTQTKTFFVKTLAWFETWLISTTVDKDPFKLQSRTPRQESFFCENVVSSALVLVHQSNLCIKCKYGYSLRQNKVPGSKHDWWSIHPFSTVAHSSNDKDPVFICLSTSAFCVHTCLISW